MFTSSKLNMMQEILSNLVAEQQLLDQYLQSIPVRNWNTKTTYKNWDITAHVSYLAALEDLANNALKKKGTEFNKYRGPKGLEKFEKEAIKKGSDMRPQDVIEYSVKGNASDWCRIITGRTDKGFKPTLSAEGDFAKKFINFNHVKI